MSYNASSASSLSDNLALFFDLARFDGDFATESLDFAPVSGLGSSRCDDPDTGVFELWADGGEWTNLRL